MVRWMVKLQRLMIPELALSLIALALVLTVLDFPTVTGLANNGDFSRVSGSLGIGIPSGNWLQTYDGYINRYFPIHPLKSGYTFYLTSALLPVWVAKLISSFILADQLDIVCVGVLYSFLYAIGVFVIVRVMRTVMGSAWAWGMGSISVILLSDVAFTLYFNSLYSEPASYVFGLLTVGLAAMLALEKKPNYMLLTLFGLSAVMFISAKVQNVPLTIVLSALALRSGCWHSDIRIWKASALTAAIFIAFSGLFVYFHEPRSFLAQNEFDSVFDGVLVGSPNPKTDLEWFGINPEYVSLTGKAYFAQSNSKILSSSQFETNFTRRVTLVSVVEFYVTHLTVFIHKMSDSARASGVLRPAYLGNFQRTVGLAPQAKSQRLAVWTFLRGHILPKGLWFTVLYWLVFLGGIVVEWKNTDSPRLRAVFEVLFALGIMAIVQFPVAYVADGRNELVKHMFTYDQLEVVGMISMVSWGLLRLFASKQNQPTGRRSSRDRVHGTLH